LGSLEAIFIAIARSEDLLYKEAQSAAMKKLLVALLLPILFVAVAPVSTSAQTNTGPTPGTFWYGIATTFENVNLFFTFNSEKKAEKALGYAERRLAQAKTAAESENSKAVETALADYEAKIALASESSRKIRDNERAEKLFTSIADNTSKHQETLSEILERVPEEARAAISRAIEASKRGQEEATRQIVELKGELEQLRQELAELKAQEGPPSQSEENVQLEAEKARWEIERVRLETEAARARAEAARAQATKQETKDVEKEEKTTIATFPSGAVVELDKNGNILRWIKEAPQQYTPPAAATQAQPVASVQIYSENITPTIASAKFEWQTSKPTESKIFLTVGGLSARLYKSDSGLSMRHSVSVSGLKGDTGYVYEIEAIAQQDDFATKSGEFRTLVPPPVPQFTTNPPNITMVEKGISGKKHNIFSARVHTDIPTTLVFTATNARCESSTFAMSHTCQVSVPVNYHNFSIVIKSEDGVQNRFDGRFDKLGL